MASRSDSTDRLNHPPSLSGSFEQPQHGEANLADARSTPDYHLAQTRFDIAMPECQAPPGAAPAVESIKVSSLPDQESDHPTKLPLKPPPEFATAPTKMCEVAHVTRRPTVRDASNNGYRSKLANKPELSQIGPYDLLEVIGEGGMGVVYRAQDRYLKRPAAVKIVKSEIALDDERWQLLVTEARATAALRNERISTLFQIGEERGQFYLAMELLHGESLESRLRRKPVPLDFALWIIREAALGLQVAHAAGFVHRDIKPANLWLETSPQCETTSGVRSAQNPRWQRPPQDSDFLRVKILDFGLARLERDASCAKKGSAAGTPAYMAPEQAAGQPVDARADLFSLGAVSYRLFTGRLPFLGSTPLEILTAIGTQSAPPVSHFNPFVPPQIVDLVRQLLSCDPLGRPASAAEVVRQIDAIQSPSSPVVTPAPSQRNYVIAIALVAVILGLGTWWGLSHHVGPPELSALEAIDTNGKVLSPQQAIHAVGEKVTVDFTVDSIELADDRVYLVASGPSSGTDAKGFRVALPAHLVAAMRRNGYDWPAALRGAQLRLVGIVERDAGFGQILAGDLDQIASISYAEGVNPKRSSGRHALDGSEEPTTPRKNQTISPLEAKKIVDDLTDAIKELTRDIILPLGSPDDKRSAIGTLPSLPQPKNPPQPK